MLAVFEVLPDDTVRARVLADWMRVDLTYRGERCVVSEAVEVLPEGGEGGHWRLEKHVYRDVEVPWYICRRVIGRAAYPEDCKIGGTYRREVDGRLEAHVKLRLFNNDGAPCHLSQSDVPIPLFALSAYLRDGTTVLNIKGIEKVDAREWEEWYRDPFVMDLAPWLRDVIADYFNFPTPPKPGVRVVTQTTDNGFVGVHLHHDLMHLDVQMWDGKCVVVDSSAIWVERRGGEYVLSGRDVVGLNAPDLPLYLCDAFLDSLFSLRDAWHEVSAWSDYVADEGVVELSLSFNIDLMDLVTRGVMEPLRPLYAIYLAFAGLPVRTIDGEEVEGWATRRKDWHHVIREEVERAAR